MRRVRRALASIGWMFFGAAVVLVCACERQDDSLAKVNLQDRIPDETLYASQGRPRPGRDEFWFGFDLRASPEEDARQYLPFLSYLSDVTGYHFTLRFTPEGGNVAEELGRGRIQFAALGASSYIQAHERWGVVPLVRGINSQGKAKYRSMIVVAPDSAIRSVPELRGKRFAFGDINSTQGHVIPRIVLNEFGIALNQLHSYVYTESHRACANAVLAGEVDACGMQDTMAEDMAQQGLVRVLHVSRFYPSSGIAVNADVPIHVRESVIEALLDFDPQGEDKAGLYHWDRTEMPNGFQSASTRDYDELRDWMIRFGLLRPDGVAAGGE